MFTGGDVRLNCLSDDSIVFGLAPGERICIDAVVSTKVQHELPLPRFGTLNDDLTRETRTQR